MSDSENKKTVLGYSESPTLYSSNIWVTTLADLYLVLLVFFIMLNSISAADKVRERKVVDSINQSFSRDSSGDNVIQIFDLPSIIETYFNNIEGIMRGAFKLEKESVNRSGNKMTAIIPAKDFFEEGEAVTKDKQRKFFKQLTDVMLQKFTGVKIYTDIMVESQAFSDAAKKGSYQIDMDRAKLIADKLMSTGIESGTISSGVGFGDGDNIVMKFSVVAVSN